MKKFLLMILVVASLSSFADEPGRERFQKVLESVQKSLTEAYENPTYATVGSARGSFFLLRSLGVIYGNEDPYFKELASASHKMTSILGRYRKAQEDYNNNPSKAHKEALERQKNSIKSSLSSTGFMQDGKVNVAGVAKKLDSINWAQTIPAEKAVVAAGMESYFKNTIDRDWNMHELEGMGIHSLRKAVRFYRKSFNLFSDVIEVVPCDKGTDDKGTCAVQVYKEGDNKCKVPKCLHDRVMSIYDVFGEIKDLGERRIANGINEHDLDKDPQFQKEGFERAQKMYKSIREDKVIERVQQAYTKCLMN